MKLFTILFILVFALSGFGQTAKRISESADGSKAVLEFYTKENRVFWKNGDSACCDVIYVEGVPFRILKSNGLNIAFTPKVFGGYYLMWVVIRNEKSTRITVKPEEATLGTWKKQEDGVLMMPAFTSPTPADKIAQKMQARQSWANVFSAIGAGIATQSATVTNNQTGQSATITAPDTNAQVNAQNRARESTNQTASLANRVINDSFKANTLFPGDETAGYIYFKVKKHERGVFLMTIEGVEYAFLYSFESNQK